MRKDDYARKNGVDKSPRKQSGVGKDDAPFRGYINLTLLPAEKEAFPEFAASDAVWSVLERHVADGENISIKRVKGEEGFLASATQRRADSVNAGLVVTARGREAAVAFLRLVYTLVLLERAESWEETQPMADPDRW